MSIDINQFWNLLTTSELVSPAQIQSLFADFAAAKLPPSATGLAKWLISRDAISSYQAKILLAGHDGPFHYGNYTVVDRFDKAQLDVSGNKDSTNEAKSTVGQSDESKPNTDTQPTIGPRIYLAVHRNTRHPVLLEFLSGSSDSDLKTWRKTESLVEQSARIRHPNFRGVFESVALANHRFIVTQRPTGVLLHTKLPRKGRLPWKSACAVMAQITRAAAALHEAGITHGSISPRCIWINKKGVTQLQLPLHPDPGFGQPDPTTRGSESKYDYLPPESSETKFSPSPTTDVYAIGCTLLRAIAGRTPFPGSSVEEIQSQHRESKLPDLSKYELPVPLVKLLQMMMAKNPEKRPADLKVLSQHLAKVSGSKRQLDSITFPKEPTLAPYLTSINQFRPGTKKKIEKVPPIDENAASDTPTTFDPNNLPKTMSAVRAEKINAAASAAVQKKQNRWKVPASIAAGVFLLASAVGVWALSANRKMVDLPSEKIEKESQPKNNESDPDPVDPNVALNAMAESERPILLQQVVDDDPTSLWETPTLGAPVDLSGLPATPKIIFVIRPDHFIANPEGMRVIQSFGPEFQSMLARLKAESGLDTADISQLVVSLHSTDQFQFAPYFVVTINQPIALERLIQFWNRPSLATTESGQQYYASGNSDQAWYVLHDGEAKEMDLADSVTRFAFGSKALITDVADIAGSRELSGPLGELAESTDRQRDFNMLYLRNALFNDEGQQWMGSRLRMFNRELSILLPEEVRAGLISMHLDEGTYVEMKFDNVVDMKPADLKNLLIQRLRTQRDYMTQFVATIPSSTYWDKVRLKYDNMLADIYRNLRWDVEHGEVAANCWLPPMAAHNLLAASELVVTFSTGTSSASVAQTDAPVPQSIDELLNIKRDLKIANPPDLNLLIADIESEVNEDHPSLPFAFHIRLLGSDLQKDGITKNQRPGELNIEQKTLGEILTQIMVGANPAKDISGSNDPNCKLIWVIADDPSAEGEKAVLITTRAAAAQKSYTLPDAFKIE